MKYYVLAVLMPTYEDAYSLIRVHESVLKTYCMHISNFVLMMEAYI